MSRSYGRHFEELRASGLATLPAGSPGTRPPRACRSPSSDGVLARSVMGRPPTHRSVTVDAIDIARKLDGSIVEQWSVPDRFALLAQVAGNGAPAARFSGVSLTIG